MSEPINECAKREYQVEQQLNIQEDKLEILEKVIESLKQRLSGILRDEPKMCGDPSEKVKEALVPVAEKARYHNSRITSATDNIGNIIALCEL